MGERVEVRHHYGGEGGGETPLWGRGWRSEFDQTCREVMLSPRPNEAFILHMQQLAEGRGRTISCLYICIYDYICKSVSLLLYCTVLL